MKDIVEKLIKLNKTISCMESCTGGYIASSITNIEGASEILKFSAVTYSNLYKIKMGVSSELIEKYTVYSIEVAQDMAYKISLFTDSDFGIGITGKINKEDKNNPYGSNNKIYISIYNKDNDKYYNIELLAIKGSREDNKKYILDNVINKLLEILSSR